MPRARPDSGFLLVFEEKAFGWHIRAGVEDETWAELANYCRQPQPFRSQQRPGPQRDDDGVRLDDPTADLDSPDSGFSPRRTMPVTAPLRSCAPCSRAACMTALVKRAG